MSKPQIGPRIQKIVKITTAESGQPTRQIIYQKKNKKKSSRALKPAEEETRRLIQAQRTFTEEYLARHDKSNRRRQDGWYYDLYENLERAYRKASSDYEDNLEADEEDELENEEDDLDDDDDEDEDED